MRSCLPSRCRLISDGQADLREIKKRRIGRRLWSGSAARFQAADRGCPDQQIPIRVARHCADSAADAARCRPMETEAGRQPLVW